MGGPSLPIKKWFGHHQGKCKRDKKGESTREGLLLSKGDSGLEIFFKTYLSCRTSAPKNSLVLIKINLSCFSGILNERTKINHYVVDSGNKSITNDCVIPRHCKHFHSPIFSDSFIFSVSPLSRAAKWNKQTDGQAQTNKNSG